MFNRISIVAPGLLGASLALAAHDKKLARSISVYARREEAVETLKQKSWCDLATSDLDDACRDTDLIFLCAPVERIISLARELAPRLTGNPIVSDVGSVKGDIVRFCQQSLEGKARFVGSHPMAGSEKTGMVNATSSLFEGRCCFVTPSEQSDPEAVRQLIAFWEAVGSEVVTESPDNHDEIVAQVSHLPHLIASSLAAFLSSARPDAVRFCGNGLRDTTRIASGDPKLWTEIVSQNRQEILRALDAFQNELQSLSASIANQRDFEVLQRLAEAKRFRDEL